ncbi:MAG TPA: methyltransferase domain-containing protein [Gammaproteobacteria bacterium]|nr:methyltransferase domain-containing protein [Gammaproteobacteria bacterium]
MTRTGDGARAHAPGLLLRAAGFYDFSLWLFMLGRERSFRERVLRAADLAPGQDVLDVGCGTGSLALSAKRTVGPKGDVYGIDASPEMLRRAESKSRKSDLAVEFLEAPAQALPFPDAKFDVVLNTLMLHHLPRTSRDRCVAEMKRVLKPGGRLVIVDFAASAARHAFSIHRHGGVRSQDIVNMLMASGLTILASGKLGFRNMHFVSASAG